MSSIQVHLETTSCEPGARVEGRIDWDAGGERVETLMVSLLWHTSGKGTEDIEIVDQITVEGPGPQGSHAFSFALPDFPWSFSGTLVSLVWSVEASLEPKGAVARTDFVSAPGAEEIRL